MSDIEKEKPNLFILGAPKCGTTTLANWLSEHPQIFVSSKKEPHHFYSPYGFPMEFDEYESLFNDVCADHKVVAEASVWYLFSEVAVPKIIEYSPRAKFIVCLRKPNEMALSLHAHTFFLGRELVENFNEAWKLSEEREKGKHIGVFGFNDGDPACMAYQKTCMLGEQVDRLLKVVDRSRVCFVLLDDLKGDAEMTWEKILDFLEVEKFTDFDLDASNRAKKRKFIFMQRLTLIIQNIKRKFGIKKRYGVLAFFNRRNIIHQKYPLPSAMTTMQMDLAFREDVKKLSVLIGRDLSSWLD